MEILGGNWVMIYEKKVTMEVYGPNHYQFMDWIDNGLQSLYAADGQYFRKLKFMPYAQ